MAQPLFASFYEKAIAFLLTIISGMLFAAINIVIDISDKVTELLVSRENHEVRIHQLEQDHRREPHREKQGHLPRHIIKPKEDLKDER